MPKPMISRSLAAKIRRAQDHVTNCRRDIIRGELLPDYLRDCISDAYAMRAEGLLSVSSLNSRVAYLERKLDREHQRQPERYLDLVQAEKALADLEIEVHGATFKPKTVLVPWPRGLSSFETVADRYMVQQARENDGERRRSKAYFKRAEAQYTREMAKHDARMRKAIADLAKSLVDAVKSGKMTREHALILIQGFKS